MVLAALQRGELKRSRRGAPAVSRQRLRHTRTGAMFQLRSRWPKLVALMNESEQDVLAYMNFPPQHRTKPRSAPARGRFARSVSQWRSIVGRPNARCGCREGERVEPDA
jgi:hypothetical protein